VVFFPVLSAEYKFAPVPVIPCGDVLMVESIPRCTIAILLRLSAAVCCDSVSVGVADGRGAAAGAGVTSGAGAGVYDGELPKHI